MNKLLRNTLIMGGLGVAASIAGRAILRRSRSFNWSGKNVLVTGGSRGLGLCLARQLVELEANVAICARTESDLRAAELELKKMIISNKCFDYCFLRKSKCDDVFC